METAKTASANSHHNIRLLPSPKQGKADWRTFRCLEVANGVTIALIHDAHAKITAAAATVATGAAADPRELPGLAHFCEHMCFLGSAKYPGENEYQRYLSQHGGRSNASTSLHYTTYKFEVLAPHAEKAIDIFSHFFVEPSFTLSGTSREVQAVDSENSKNRTADGRRRLQILKSIADNNHYYSKFTTGNAKTLKTDTPEDLQRVREALLCFHRIHYRPDNLTVVVAGPQSLDQLQDWVVPRFAEVKTFQPSSSSNHHPTNNSHPVEPLVRQAAREAPVLHFRAPEPPPDPAFAELSGQSWPFLVTNQPLQSMRKLVLMFPLPPVQKHPDQSPEAILSHLLGHEGPHSAFALLQNHGWITALAAGCRVAAPDFTLWQIDVSLTESGEQHWKHVADLLFQHCRWIHTCCVQQPERLREIWQENTTLARIFFDHTSPRGVYDTCPTLCQNIVAYGTEECLAAGHFLRESATTFPLESVRRFAAQLTTNNCILERCSADAWNEAQNCPIAERKTEPWYGLDYFVTPIDADDVARWDGKAASFVDGSDLDLPHPNRFIPRSLELCPDLPEEAKQGPRIERPIDPPRLIVDDAQLGRLWYRLDDRYALPKSILSLLVRNAAVHHVKEENKVWQPNTSSSMHASLVAAMFHDAMAQETYDADLAGLHWNLGLNLSGIKLSCSGFSDRLPDLALLLVQEFQSGLFLKESYFYAAQDRLKRQLMSFYESRRADSLALYYRDLVMTSQDQDIDESLAVAQATTLESVQQYHRALLENEETAIECFVTGNTSECKAIAFFREAARMIKKNEGNRSLSGKDVRWFPAPIERRLEPGAQLELHFESRNPQEENGAVVLTFQSSIPGFRGEKLSLQESLQSTAAIRLLATIIREPCFDTLRTQQALGYIVSSYYDLGFAAPTCNQSHLGIYSIPVDLLVFSILSRKLPPPDIVTRIDDFLASFRDTLVNMPESEIKNYANALSTKLLKPFQTLNEEASNHFSKIQRYAPELNGIDLPWTSVETLAEAIRNMGKEDLLNTWDRLTHASSRSRVVSCVYGTTFPLEMAQHSPGPLTTSITNSLSELLSFRKRMPLYDNTIWRPNRLKRLLKSKTAPLWGATALIGVGLVGWTLWNRSKKVR